MRDQSDSADRLFGVVVYLSEAEQGTVLRLDDLEFAGGTPPKWGHWAFFTSLPFDEERTLAHTLSEEDYASLGKAVLSRLAAFYSLKHGG